MRKLFSFLLLLAAVLLPVTASADHIDTSARACVIIDEATGRILLSHNETEPLPMASTTKIMTALLAMELGQPDAPVTCGRNAFGVPGTSIYLSEGETLTLTEMLYGLMLASGNDAATAIAEHIGGTTENFCRMMTERAAEIGCQNTVFLTPHGLPQDGHYTTALDLALIAREAMKQPLFRTIVSTRRATIPWEGREYDRVLNNKNKLLSTYDGATGIKTGYTKKAGRCLVFGAERNGMRIIGIVLNCPDWFDEAARLMDEAFARFESVTMLQKGDEIGWIQVTGSDTESIRAIMAGNLSGVIRQGAIPSVEISIPESLQAPVRRGDVIGTAYVMAGNDIVGQCDIISETDALCSTLPTQWQRLWENWLLLHTKRPETDVPGRGLFS